MKKKNTYRFVNASVSNRRLYLTDRREARICAKGVTIYSSPWLQDQTEIKSIFYVSSISEA